MTPNRNRCPGWGVEDCPSGAWVEAARRDRCPVCTALNRRWERDQIQRHGRLTIELVEYHVTGNEIVLAMQGEEWKL